MFADETIKANIGLDDSNPQEFKAQVVDHHANDAISAVEDEIDAMKEDEESNTDAIDDDCDNDNYEDEEEEDDESDNYDDEIEDAAGEMHSFICSV